MKIKANWCDSCHIINVEIPEEFLKKVRGWCDSNPNHPLSMSFTIICSSIVSVLEFDSELSSIENGLGEIKRSESSKGEGMMFLPRDSYGDAMEHLYAARDSIGYSILSGLKHGYLE